MMRLHGEQLSVTRCSPAHGPAPTAAPQRRQAAALSRPTELCAALRLNALATGQCQAPAVPRGAFRPQSAYAAPQAAAALPRPYAASTWPVPGARPRLGQSGVRKSAFCTRPDIRESSQAGRAGAHRTKRRSDGPFPIVELSQLLPPCCEVAAQVTGRSVQADVQHCGSTRAQHVRAASHNLCVSGGSRKQCRPPRSARQVAEPLACPRHARCGSCDTL